MQDLGQSKIGTFWNLMRLMIHSDLNNSLMEDDILADISLDPSGGSHESDEWFLYPNKTVSVLQWITQAMHTDILL